MCPGFCHSGRAPARARNDGEGPRPGRTKALDETAMAAYLCAVPPSRILSASSAETARAAAGPVSPMVREPWLVAARAPIGAIGKGPRRPLGAVDRPDRRRQDARRIFADPGGVERAPRRPRASRAGGVFSTGRGVQPSRGLHTLYISPLKALAVDIARNLETPIAEMALPIKVETRTGDTPVSRRQRQRRYPPDILLTTPEQLALLLSSDDAPFLFASLERIVLDELHALVTSKRGDLLSLGLARLWRLAPETARDRPVRHRRRAGIAGAVSGAASRRPKRSRRYRRRRRRRGAGCRNARHTRAAALGRAQRAPCARRNLRSDPAPQHHAGIRQHPQPGRDAVSGSVAHERRWPCHRAASWLARCRAAPQGRGRDGGGTAARRGLHLLARSWRRLGRRRSRHQYRRAEGRLAADAADRPRQSPHRRSLPRGAGSGQSLRGAGVPGGDRCHRGECAGHPAAAHRRARRFGAACARLRLRRAVCRG